MHTYPFNYSPLFISFAFNAKNRSNQEKKSFTLFLLERNLQVRTLLFERASLKHSPKYNQEVMKPPIKLMFLQIFEGKKITFPAVAFRKHSTSL